ncbi:Composite of metallo-dependent hydrolase [Glarea lozoyensis ATCC 20868]|uniref:Composite of metallo-dependent hydrolase n=1 Tax=Glarea lozoyensis (strain ATCC 20868 / MF5171) TaxID=1116229 RepID=S3DGU0_GLAL2|nr:Composite of metallo-dependent hydrolase [Glarea lozoyensis ATCC 20868]EPE36915.1 Composite of metallo-dependent hydrolase [Glarea lozoyensis ATCC 20868]
MASLNHAYEASIPANPTQDHKTSDEQPKLDQFVAKTTRLSWAKPTANFLLICAIILYIIISSARWAISDPSPDELRLQQFYTSKLEVGLQRCAESQRSPIKYPETKAGSRHNPRWNPVTGQNTTLVLKNATLFDGEKFLEKPVDIVFKYGIIDSVTNSGKTVFPDEYQSSDLRGAYVTPGLVDMHSHHLAISWPILLETDDSNEVNPETGPLTPQVRVIDSIKAYDIATTIIASGGVTTSLILPGSANIMGGEAVIVKNLLCSGPNGEEVVEEILLEHGIPLNDRRRYMKMACGTNPRAVYDHTRMGTAWIFRKHMARARELMLKQDEWCLTAQSLQSSSDAEKIAAFVQKTDSEDLARDYLEYDSSIAMLKGQIGVNVHCYETEDMEDMMKHSKEFGFRIQAFHHALDAWEVPEMLKASGDNITIATFAEMGLYKKEAYEANLWAGRILAEHGVPVAYKSDHVGEETSAKYLLHQAATAHAFQLSEELALQSVTSVPAKSLEVDHRVGYVRPGYDADIVVWNSHPLSVGATAIQVYIDGRATLDPKTVAESGAVIEQGEEQKTLVQKSTISSTERQEICDQVEKDGARITITGIRKSYLNDEYPATKDGNATMVIKNGEILCFASHEACSSHITSGPIINLKNGHVLPGLTAVSVSLGLSEIALDSGTSDGIVGKSPSSVDPENVVYAKYGIHFDGRGFARARIGGVTRAVSAPLSNGFADGVSVGILTSGKKTILDGGIFQEDVALHFRIGQNAKSASLPTISSSVHKLRQLLHQNTNKTNIYGRASRGEIPLVVHANDEYDISQLISLKHAFNTTNLILHGGASAHLVATHLAAASIPVLLSHPRPAPDSFSKRSALPGPPLSQSPVRVLTAAGVKVGLASAGENDSHIHNLMVEASWAGKLAGLSRGEAVGLVAGNVEGILGLNKAGVVVWEGDPLEFGADVVVSFEGGGVGSCWPVSN